MAKRKLTTIFCADAVQYGALMAANEDETLARLSEYRAVMNDQFARYEGREINTWGDAIIAEFDSVVEAVRCAVEIQTALNSRNEMLPKNRKLQFRIGINLGDVIHQGDNIYGDGVNAASRLESMADRMAEMMIVKCMASFGTAPENGQPQTQRLYSIPDPNHVDGNRFMAKENDELLC